MKKPFLHRLKGERGWTIIELIIIVAIMSIIFSVVAASYESLKAKVRFSQVKADMDSITNAAYSDFTGSPSNTWAAMVMPGTAPSFVGSTNLAKWPRPPCPYWVYSWDNFYAVPGVKAVRLTLRRQDLSAIWSVCLENYGGSCQGNDGFGGNPPELSSVNTKYVYCNE